MPPPARFFALTPARAILPALAAAVFVLTPALEGFVWSGPFFDLLGFFALLFIVIPSIFFVEVVGFGRFGPVFTCDMFSCTPGHPLAWIALAAVEVALLYLLSCLAAAAWRRLRQPGEPKKP